MLKWDHMRIALVIHRQCSMQAAAEAMGADRATVLRRLDALGAQFTARLFHRRSHGSTLKAEGRKIIDTLEHISDAMIGIERKTKGVGRRDESIVSVILPEFFAVEILAHDLPEFLSRHPGITINVVAGPNFLNLAQGEADIALRNRRPDHIRLVPRKVCVVGIGLFASHGYVDQRGMPQAGNYAGHNMILFNSVHAGTPAAPGSKRKARTPGLRCARMSFCRSLPPHKRVSGLTILNLTQGIKRRT